MTVPRLAHAGRFLLDALYRPRSLAVIGAETQAGAEITANLALSGFHGTLQSVAHPADLTAAPDLAVLAVPPEAVIRDMEALATKGCFATIVPGPADGLPEAASRTGVRVLGPHSFGLAIPGIGLNATRSHLAPPAGRLALVSQSAALCRAVIDWAGPNGVGFSHIVGIGGNADLGFGPALDWLSRDPGTGAILLDIRRLKNRRVFLSAARAAARLRPVVAIRAGGRLLDDGAGDAELAFEAALRRAGVLRVERLEDLLAAAETLTRVRPPRSETLAIVTNAIGPGRMAADAALRHGLRLAALDGADHGIVHVPLESADRIAPTAARVAAARGVGGVLVVLAPTGAADAAIIASLIEAGPHIPAPLLICALGETTGALHRAALVRAGLAVFATPEQAVRGFDHLVQDRRNRAAARELPPSAVLAHAPDRSAVRRVFADARRDGRGALFQDEALDVLGVYGIPTVPTRAVPRADDAVDAAMLLGFPVVAKLRQFVPPAERPPGGLALDLHDAHEAQVAARLLVARQTRRERNAPDRGPDTGVLLQRQVGRAREFAVRVRDDPTFGPMIAFGPGGTTAAALHDVAMDLPPLNLPLAHGLIARSRLGAMLGQRLRDLPAANEAAVAEALVRISQLVVDFPELAELEVSALFVDAGGVLAADAWLRLRGPDEAPGLLVIAPYPVELVEHRMFSGEAFVIRPIRPEDADAHGAFFKRLPPLDVRYRFFSSMRELSAEQMARLTQIDYDREMAFIAVREATGETVGVARLVRESDGRTGEFAVIVQPDVKGKGVASHLMRRLIDWAHRLGLAEMVGQVLSENAPMLGFVRALGFSLRRMPEEPDVIEARMAVT
jgi:acetyltransferase